MAENEIIRKQDVLPTRTSSTVLGAAGAVQCAIGSFAIMAALPMDRIESWRISNLLLMNGAQYWGLVFALRLLAGVWIVGCGLLTWRGRPRAAYHAVLPAALLLLMTLLGMSDSWSHFQQAFRYGLALWALDALVLSWLAYRARGRRANHSRVPALLGNPPAPDG